MTFQLGSLVLPNKILYSPLAGCSDFPQRKMACRYVPGIVYCEMVKTDAIVRNDLNTFRMLDYDGDMHPIGAQLCGSKPQVAAEAARIVADLGFDVIDLNCGCPVDKVTKDGSGSGMLKNPQFIGEMISAMVAAVDIPVTVKIRAGWDEHHINAVEITKIAEAAGAKAIAIHGRTRQQAYRGKANWDYIKECKKAAQTIQVIGNGDLFDAQSVVRMFASTGCDAVLISRGTMGQPWIVADSLRALNLEVPIQRSVADMKKTLFEHFDLIMSYQPERKALLDMKRVGSWYLKRLINAKKLRMKINYSSSTKEVFEHLKMFEWGFVELLNPLK